MCLPYDNVENAQQHLLGTIVFYDERPYYVSEIYRGQQKDITANLTALPRMRDVISVSIFDPAFDAKIVGRRLGYVNLESGAIWTTRVPSRQYKQGLVRQNVAINVPRGRDRIPFEILQTQPSFTDTLRGIYPTYDEAKKKLDDNPGIPSVAFHREFCLERQDLGYFLLSYRNERVAWGDPKKFKLPKQFAYLTEMLNQLGVPHES